MRQLQTSGRRFGPRELEGHPEIIEKIVELFVTKGWCAKRTAKYFNDPRITPRTVYGISQRYRKRQQKVLREAEAVRDRVRSNYSPPTNPRGTQSLDVPSAVETIQLDEIDPSLVPWNEDEVDAVQLRKNNRTFMLQQAEQAAILSQKIIRSASASIDSDNDPHGVDAQIRSWERMIAGWKMLAGIEDAPKKTKNLHLHHHLLGEGDNPFG
jgi:hypothetical protein